jgi:hypothetical protein
MTLRLVLVVTACLSIVDLSAGQFSAYDQTIIPFSIYNADGNPNNIITNSECVPQAELDVSDSLTKRIARL